MKPSYKTNDPKGWFGGDMRYGAAMGRRTIAQAPREYAGRLYLSRVYLNGDYDANGTYFEYVPGKRLWWCASPDGAIDFIVSVMNWGTREVAKAEVRKRYPNVKFYGERTTRPKFYECGICGAHHSVDFSGDCRQNSARLDPSDLDARYGALGWDEVEMSK